VLRLNRSIEIGEIERDPVVELDDIEIPYRTGVGRPSISAKKRADRAPSLDQMIVWLS